MRNVDTTAVSNTRTKRSEGFCILVRAREKDLEFGISDCGDGEGVGEWERRKLGKLFIFVLR
jgi:hypothetical protein